MLKGREKTVPQNFTVCSIALSNMYTYTENGSKNHSGGLVHSWQASGYESTTATYVSTYEQTTATQHLLVANVLFFIKCFTFGCQGPTSVSEWYCCVSEWYQQHTWISNHASHCVLNVNIGGTSVINRKLYGWGVYMD